MPYFAIHCIDKPLSGALRAATRPEHLAYLRGFAPSILVAGPLLGLDGEAMGSLLIVDFPDRGAAYRFAAEDPYALGDLFQSVAITAWRRTLPESEPGADPA